MVQLRLLRQGESLAKVIFRSALVLNELGLF